MESKIFLIIAAVAVVVLVVAGSVVSYKVGYGAGAAQGTIETSLGVKCPICQAAGPIDNVAAVVGNPLEDMPSVNPLEGVVNPFKDSYKNPFE